jgi:GNAT superfamily N-acetyltransferase
MASDIERARAMKTRRAIIGDEALLRRLRLEALTFEPYAFGSTLDRELARTVEDWRRWISSGVVFLLEDDRGAKGLVAGAHDASEPAVVQLMAMWVHPDARGSGGSDALVSAVVAWAQSERAKVVRLQVVNDNLRARRCYERNGFVATGRTSRRERDGAAELQMERAVARDHDDSVKPSNPGTGRECCG